MAGHDRPWPDRPDRPDRPELFGADRLDRMRACEWRSKKQQHSAKTSEIKGKSQEKARNTYGNHESNKAPPLAARQVSTRFTRALWVCCFCISVRAFSFVIVFPFDFAGLGDMLLLFYVQLIPCVTNF